MSAKRKQNYAFGLKAESAAALWLQMKGYKILARRYKTPMGEIDLIARKGNLLAFIEVKARQTKHQALESLTPQMRSRIERAASSYISHNPVGNCDMRFDLITVTPPFFIHHLDNAWQQAA